MEKCKNCGKEIKEGRKFCSPSCSSTFNNKQRAAGNRIIKVKKHCEKCGNEFEVERILDKNGKERIPKKERSFCSRSCANGHKHTKEWNNKISQSLKGKKKPSKTENHKDKKRINKEKKGKKKKTFCKVCKKEINLKNKHSLCGNCWRKSDLFLQQCKSAGTIGGRKSASKQNKRSKNEIYFYELCTNYFNNVKHNESIFNGWDADIIIEDNETAILWNGKWHYEKITEAHSLKQVQNRDKIKLKEIRKCGWKAYIIKDLGKYNKKFVEKKFNEFIHRGVV